MNEDWKAKVRFTDLWDDFYDDEIVLETVIGEVEQRLLAVAPILMRDDEFNEIMDDLDLIECVEDFDDWTSRLYDWGDVDKRLWVETQE